DLAILHRALGVGAAARAGAAGAAVGAATAVGVAATPTATAPAAALLGLVLQLLDQLVQAVDDLLLDLLGLRAAAAQVQPALAVIHQPADVPQVLLPGLHVQEHQGRHGLVALGAVHGVLDQADDGPAGFFLLEQGVLADRAVEEVGGRV